MLRLENVVTGYGETQVLHGVSLEIGKGEVVALMGRNGAGKTTVLRSIIGLNSVWSGHIYLDDKDITGTKPHVLAVAGLGYLPEHRGIFPSLTVHENLTLVQGRRPGPWTIKRAYDLFPHLAERRHNGGAQLSGGEQQMLAIARALLLNPKVLLLDEPTEGLAPLIISEIAERLVQVRSEGTTILLVEQNTRFALNLANRAYVLSRGEVKWEGETEALMADTAVQAEWLGV